jgi:hypothetical protein
MVLIHYAREMLGTAKCQIPPQFTFLPAYPAPCYKAFVKSDSIEKPSIGRFDQSWAMAYPQLSGISTVNSCWFLTIFQFLFPKVRF